MNKNLLLWAIIIIVIALTYLGVFFLGRSSIKSPTAKIEVKEIVKYDTVTTIRKIFVNRIIETKTTGDSVKSYFDSIVGDTNQVKFNIQHSISDSQKVVRSWWKVNIKPHLITIVKTITKDSIQTKINNVYLTKPFLLDTYFYTTIIATFLLILKIIF